jgi:hypothetical protein
MRKKSTEPLLKDKWCVYISQHPKGFFYKGKGKTEAVLTGKYKGSGTYFKAAVEFGNLPWDEWTSSVIATFDEEEVVNGKDPGEVKAYAYERDYITDLDLCNPYCLNKSRTNFGGLTMKMLDRLRRKAAGKPPKSKSRKKQPVIIG